MMGESACWERVPVGRGCLVLALVWDALGRTNGMGSVQ